MNRRRSGPARTVLVVCGPGDEHAIVVALHLAELGVRAVPVDLARLPETTFAVRLGGRRAAPGVLLGTDDGLVDPAACEAIWWRRPRLPVPASFDAASASPSPGPAPRPAKPPAPPRASPPAPRGGGDRARALTHAEWTAALEGLIRVAPGRWVNDPGAEELARRKLVQLEAARRVGLPVPRTLVTNDPSAARRFIAGCRRGAVVKSLSSVQEGGFTRAARDDEQLASRLRAGPAIVQERLEGLDLRVTVVGEKVFAMSLDARAGGDPDDVRASWELVRASARPVRLPAALEARLVALLRSLGLVFGAIDLRGMRGGGYAFLEVNPSGQWLHAEAATGHPIGATLARLLATTRAGRRAPR